MHWLHIRIATVLSLMLGLTTLVGCGGSGDTANTMKISTVLPKDHASSKALRHFADRLAKLSDGQLKAEVYYNSRLADAAQGVEMAQNGTIEMAYTSAAPLSQTEPMFSVLTMPFLFRDAEHMHRVLDGEIGRTLAGTLSDDNLRVLGYLDAGSRNIMTKAGPIRTPSDLNGKVIRVMNSQVMRDTLDALGASPKPMDQSAVYSALQTGNLDGWENNPPTALTFNMYETGCDHFAWTRHLMVPDLLLINKEVYDGMAADQQKALDQSATQFRKKQRELWANAIDEAIAKLKKAGMTFNEVDRAVFRERVAPVYDKYKQEHGQQFADLIERIRADNDANAIDATASN
jgi:tripartite ATP-independent transporter DctP family solute receptor